MTLRLLLYLLSVSKLLSAPAWIEAKGPHLAVYTDAGEAAGRRILLHLEAAWDFFGASGDTPIQVLAFAHEADFAPLRPSSGIAGFAQTGPGADTIVFAFTGQGRQIAMHEFAHILLKRKSVQLPHWFEEGLSEFYSTIDWNGSRLHIGAPVESHELRLHQSGAGSAAKFDQPGDALFYPRSWALVHMLYIDPAFRGRIHDLAAALDQGDSTEAAFEKIYHQSFANVVSTLDDYVHRPFRSVDVEAGGRAGVDIAVRKCSNDEPIEIQAAVLEQQERFSDAERLYQRLAKNDPHSAAYHHWLAGRALRTRDYTVAAAEMRLALEARPADGAILFDYAMLLRETRAPDAQVLEALNRTVAANPTNAQAHLLLGEQLSAHGDSTEAIVHLRRAAQLAPRDAFSWQALAFQYHRSGDDAQSRDAARRSRSAAVTPQEIAMAESALGLSNPQPKPATAATETPAAWDNPRGDARIEGQMTSVDCSATPVTVRVGAESLRLSSPDRISLRGTRGVKAELRCGAQNVRVVVEYQSATREVTSIAFQF